MNKYLICAALAFLCVAVAKSEETKNAQITDAAAKAEQMSDTTSENAEDAESAEEPASEDSYDIKLAGLSRADAKKLLKDSVITQENGDILLPPFPKIDTKEIDKYEALKPAIPYLPYLLFFDRALNFESLVKAIDQKAKKNSDGSYIYNGDTTFKGFNNYLRGKNMSWQRISFQSNNIRSRIESGQPVICVLTRSPDLNTEITHRTKSRKDFADPAEWLQVVRKADRTQIDTKVPDGYTVFGTVIGINRKTGEFLVKGAARRPVWLTDKEINKLVQETYTVRF